MKKTPWLWLVLPWLVSLSPAWGGERDMKPMYEFSWFMRYEEHAPRIYPLPKAIAEKFSLGVINPMPFPNAVGSNDLYNAITRITFNERGLSVDILRKDFLKQVSGGNAFTELFSQSVIGYVQERRFVLFDVHTGYFRAFSIVRSLSESVDKAEAFDPAETLFLFQTNKDVPNTLNGMDFELLLVDLRTELLEHKDFIELMDEPQRIKARYSLAKNVESPGREWRVVNKKVFIYGNRKTADGKTKPEIEVLDGQLRKTDHPLLHAYAAMAKDFGEIVNVVVHPTLPLALVVEYKNKITGGFCIWAVTWRKGLQQPAHCLFNEGGDYSFSPDGRWLVYTAGGGSEGSNVYVSAVDEKLKYYIGPPIKLADNIKFGSHAWTHEPQGFVVNTRTELYRWDISDEAIKAKHLYTKDNTMPAYDAGK